MQKRDRMAAWLFGEGLEIGALNRPMAVPAGVQVSYVDRLDETSLREHYPDLKDEPLVPVTFLGDAQDLSAVADDSQDFVIVSHVVEHLENPVQALVEMHRVLRPDGVLYLGLPDPRRTFDALRRCTTTAHVLDEWRHGTSPTRRAHYEEWVDLVENTGQDVAAGKRDARVADLMAQDFSIHFHVWRPDTFLQLWNAVCQELGWEWELVDFEACSDQDNEFVFVFRKGVALGPVARPQPTLSVREAVLHTSLGPGLRRARAALWRSASRPSSRR